MSTVVEEKYANMEKIESRILIKKNWAAEEQFLTEPFSLSLLLTTVRSNATPEYEINIVSIFFSLK